MKNMIIYYLKKRWYVILAITIIILFLNIVTIDPDYFISNRYIYEGVPNDYIVVPQADAAPIGYMTLFACILATIIPMFEFYFKMRKVSIDQLYSLPIKREKIYLTKYIIGLIETLIPLIINYLVIILIVALSEHMFDFKYIILYLPVLLGLTVVLYTIVSFVYTRGNSYFDGIINVFLYTFILVLPIALLASWNIDKNAGWSWFFTYSPLTCAFRIFENLIENRSSSFNGWDLTTFILFTILAIISFISLLKLNKLDKSENSMQISESWFSYKVMLPTYCVLGSMLARESIIIVILIFISTFLGYVIYKRTFKLTKKELLFIGLLYFISILMAISSELIYEAINSSRNY